MKEFTQKVIERERVTEGEEESDERVIQVELEVCC